MMSATSSGGVSSIVSRMAWMMAATDGSRASRIWSLLTSTLRADRSAGRGRGR